MKITCPKCKNSMPFHVSTTFTDRQTCEKCGYEIDLRDCKLYYWMRLFLALLGGVAVVIYGNDILAPYIADWTLRVFVLLLITLVLLLIVMYLVAPVFYNRTYVRKPSIGKKKSWADRIISLSFLLRKPAVKRRARARLYKGRGACPAGDVLKICRDLVDSRVCGKNEFMRYKNSQRFSLGIFLQ